MEINKPADILMININGEKKRPLGIVNNIPIEIHGEVIPIDAIVTESNSYTVLVGTDWLAKTKARLNFNNSTMTLIWNNQSIEILIEYTDKWEKNAIPWKLQNKQKQKEEKTEEEAEEEEETKEEETESDSDSEEETEEEYEEEYLQQQLYYYNQQEAIEITNEMQQQMVPENTPKVVQKEFFYQYEETKEKGKFYTGTITEKQEEQFKEFMKDYQDLFVWTDSELGKTSLVKHSIDTGNASPIKQCFYRTSHHNEQFIKEEIQWLLKIGMIKSSMSP